MTPLRVGLSLFVLALVTSIVPAAEIFPTDKPIEAAIDYYVDQLMKADGITPAGQADDATLIRRLTLDLVGRIPTQAEVTAYVTSTNPNKRAELVDRLIASPGFIRHQATQFDLMLNANSENRRSVREYLAGALKDGKGWDKIFRDLMLPDETDPKLKGTSEYLRGRVTDLDRLTNDVSVSFFGVNVSCAQCHDHPLVVDWKQDHFYGMKSFFARTYEAGNGVGEREAGLIKFKPTKGPERSAKLMFLTGAEVKTDTLREPTKDEQKKEKELTEKAKAAKGTPVPAPKFSARAQLVSVALQPKESVFFSRNLVNRLWHRYLGMGLVSPLDQMHSENPPTHPELLDWLAGYAASHGYDIRRLTRGIVMSKTYSRSSRFASESQPNPIYFAVARLKPLTPMQLASSLKIATTDPAQFEGLKPEELEKRLEGIDGSARGMANLFAIPTDDFQVGVGEALLFSNSDRLQKELLSDNGILGKLKTVKDPALAAEMLVKVAYNRPPTAQEKATLVEYLGCRTDRINEAYRQVLWALLTSAEFRFSS